jgi:protein-S-isoprenylcysteine O-methyltransferase Ste14
MQLDIRLPIGGMFSLFGLILIVYGALSPSGIYGKSLGININLWWGVILLGFGVVMLLLAWKASPKKQL